MDWLRNRWLFFWFEPRSGFDLAVCRIIFFLGLFVFYLPQDNSPLGAAAEILLKRISYYHFLGLDLPSIGTLQALRIVWLASLLTSALGIATRFSTAVAFVLGVYLIGLPYNFGKTDHYDALFAIALCVMAVSRCGDRVSLDARIAAGRGKGREQGLFSSEYTWPIRMVWVLLAAMYLAAGIAKLRNSGLGWITSEFLAQAMVHSYHKGDPATDWGLYLAQSPLLCRGFAMSTLVIELGFWVALFSKRARLLLLPAAYGMHVGIFLIMGPGFLNLVVCYLFWVPWEDLSRWLRRPGPRVAAT